MSVVTVVPTVEAGYSPPRVRLDVTDTGTSPSIFSTTVVRIDPDGRRVPVRTNDGGPLTLSTSGSNRVGLLYDYEAPLGAPVAYSTEQSPSTTSAAVTAPSSQVWLVHPGVPALSAPVEFRAGSLDDETWDIEQAILWPMGATTPVVHTDGTRRAPSGSVTVAIDTLSQLATLRALVSDGSVLQLNVPVDLGLGIDTCYIAVGAIRNARPSDIGTDPHRAVTLPFQVVNRPAGGTQAERTWLDVVAENTTWDQVLAKYDTWFDLLAGP